MLLKLVGPPRQLEKLAPQKEILATQLMRKDPMQKIVESAENVPSSVVNEESTSCTSIVAACDRAEGLLACLLTRRYLQCIVKASRISCAQY